MLRNAYHKLQSLAHSCEGIAYVEFAITLPFLLLLFLGGLEVTRYILIVQKVEKVSVTMSDLVAQEQSIGTTEMNNLILAAAQVMEPFTFDTSSNAYVIVSSVTKTGSANPIVSWQYKTSGTYTQTSQIGTTGSTATLPNNFTMVAGDNVIMSEVYYYYTPLMGAVVGNVLGSSMIYRVAIFKPRLGALSSLGS